MILLCVVLMWLLFNWREAVTSAKTYETMLTRSDIWHANWNALTDKQGERDSELIKRFSDTAHSLHLEVNQLHEELRKARRDNELINDWNQRLTNENDELRSEIYESRKALWIERNGPPGGDDVFF